MRDPAVRSGVIPPMLCDLLLIERGHDRLGIAYGQASGVGVSPVQDDLDVRRASALKVGRKVGAYVESP